MQGGFELETASRRGGETARLRDGETELMNIGGLKISFGLRNGQRKTDLVLFRYFWYLKTKFLLQS